MDPLESFTNRLLKFNGFLGTSMLELLMDLILGSCWF